MAEHDANAVQIESQARMLRTYQQWLADKEFLLAEALAKNGLQSQRISWLEQENYRLEDELTKPTA